MGNADDGKMKLEVIELLEHFKGRLESGSLEFLTKPHRENVLASVESLLTDHFKPAKKEYLEAVKSYSANGGKIGKPRKPNLSDYLIWNEVHEQGHKLWTHLMRAAIVAIDPNAKGHSELLNYLDAATKFEDLLYGLEEFYRDHTLHSLWVYLIGVKLMDEDRGLKKIAENLNWYVCNDVRKGEYPESVVEWASLKEKCLNEEVQKNKDAIWCVMALCHDLGYSLAKLEKLNEKVQGVLKYYDVSDFRHVGYTLDLEHQYLVTQCLDLMAMDVRITPGDDCPEYPREEADKNTHEDLLVCIKEVENKRSENPEEYLERETLRSLLLEHREDNDETKKKGAASTVPRDLALRVYDNVLTKCFRDDASYWRLCKALERKEHGVLSAYLLYKTMGLFADTSVRSPAEGCGLDDDEAVDNIIRGDILFGIAQHEFAFAHIDQMSSLAEILILCDELEEFTRLGRQLQSRKYHDTTADARVCVELASDAGKETPRPDRRDIRVSIAMTYDSRHEELEDFVKFCWRKARRLCKLFSLVPDKREKTANKERAYRINKIQTTFNYYDKPIGEDNESDDKADPTKQTIVFTMRDNTNEPASSTGEQHAVEITFPDKKQTTPVELECRDDDIYVTGTTLIAVSDLEEWQWVGSSDKEPPSDSRLVKLLWEVYRLNEKDLPDAKK